MDTLPNVEEIVIEWLSNLVSEDWPVSGDSPEPKPDQYILVDRTGGPRIAMVLDASTILIEVFHKNSRSSASHEADIISDSIRSLTNYESITRAEVNSLVKLDDTINQYFRYQIYCDIYNRR